MKSNADRMGSRTIVYAAMVAVLVAIFIGASRGAAPVYLAVGFICEVILASTAHLSSVIQQHMTSRLP